MKYVNNLYNPICSCTNTGYVSEMMGHISEQKLTF